LRTHTRAGDLLCRYGGEEFLVVLPNTSAAQARQRAEAWRKAFAESVTEYDGHQLRATLSAGIAEYRPRREGEPVGMRPRHDLEAGEDTVAEALLRAADRALYTAKENGRDQVALFAQ
jgi:diguanylate cyclase (GGDEF)-like protein